MNPANPDYQRLILEHVAPRLAATGVDGFFLDNMEIVEHGATGNDTGAPCNRACVAGTLTLVARLRRAFPEFAIVMQNATSATTREAVVDGVPFPRLLDGISREEVYTPRYDSAAEAELLAWKILGGSREEGPLSSRRSTTWATAVIVGARFGYIHEVESSGFSPYVTISSADQNTVCLWRL